MHYFQKTKCEKMKFVNLDTQTTFRHRSNSVQQKTSALHLCVSELQIKLFMQSESSIIKYPTDSIQFLSQSDNELLLQKIQNIADFKPYVVTYIQKTKILNKYNYDTDNDTDSQQQKTQEQKQKAVQKKLPEADPIDFDAEEDDDQYGIGGEEIIIPSGEEGDWNNLWQNDNLDHLCHSFEAPSQIQQKGKEMNLIAIHFDFVTRDHDGLPVQESSSWIEASFSKNNEGAEEQISSLRVKLVTNYCDKKLVHKTKLIVDDSLLKNLNCVKVIQGLNLPNGDAIAEKLKSD